MHFYIVDSWVLVFTWRKFVMTIGNLYERGASSVWTQEYYEV